MHFVTETGYWAATGLDDVQRWSRDNRSDAAEVGARAASGDWSSALAAFARLQAGCRACHDQHPEKRVQVGP